MSNEIINMELFNVWLLDRPQIIKDMAAKFPPDKLYKLNFDIATVTGYNEDGTFYTSISHDHNPSYILERQVFGVKSEDLIMIYDWTTVEDNDIKPDILPKNVEIDGETWELKQTCSTEFKTDHPPKHIFKDES